MSVFTEKLDFLVSRSIDCVDCTHVVIVPLTINLNLNRNPLYPIPRNRIKNITQSTSN